MKVAALLELLQLSQLKAKFQVEKCGHALTLDWYKERICLSASKKDCAEITCNVMCIFGSILQIAVLH